MNHSVVICIFIVVALIIVLLKLIAKSLREKEAQKFSDKKTNKSVAKQQNKVSDYEKSQAQKNREIFKRFEVESEKYAMLLVSESNETLQLEDAKAFVDILVTYAASGKEKALENFDYYANEIIVKYGILSTFVVSFLIGVLKANGIIEQTEVKPMTDKYKKEIYNTYMENPERFN